MHKLTSARRVPHYSLTGKLKYFSDGPYCLGVKKSGGIATTTKSLQPKVVAKVDVEILEEATI